MSNQSESDALQACVEIRTTGSAYVSLQEYPASSSSMSLAFADFSATIEGADTPCPVVIIRGEVDVVTALDMVRCILEAAKASPAVVVLDVAAMTFIDAAGLGAIVYARNHLPATCEIVLRYPRPFIRRLLAITKMGAVCTF